MVVAVAAAAVVAAIVAERYGGGDRGGDRYGGGGVGMAVASVRSGPLHVAATAIRRAVEEEAACTQRKKLSLAPRSSQRSRRPDRVEVEEDLWECQAA